MRGARRWRLETMPDIAPRSAAPSGSSLGERARVLAHPIVLALLALWALNDHVLKSVAPGPVTGKVSDVTGLIVFPLLVGTLWPRRHPWAVGIATTVTVFSAVNLSDRAATGTADVLATMVGPSRLHADPTDLLVLPAVLAAGWIAAHPPGHRWARAVGRGALAVGLLTTVATSRIDDGTEHVLGAEGAVNGVAVGVSPLQDNIEEPGCTDVWASADGEQWVKQPARSNCPRRPRRPATPPPPVSAQRACLADGTTCFRIDEDLIERSLDGGSSWNDTWRWPTDRDRFDWRWCPLGCAFESRGPHAIAVARFDRVETVVVAMGHEGMLLSTDGVTWQQASVGPTGDPASLTGDGLLMPEHLVVLTFAVLLLAVTLQIGRLPERVRRRVPAEHPVRRRHRIWLAGWGAVVLLSAAVGGGAAFWRFSEGHIWLWSDAIRWTGIALGGVTLAALLVAYVGRRATLAQLR